MPDQPSNREALEQRFWSKVDKSGECWQWTGAINQGGYGHFGIGRKVKRSHRVSYWLSHGPIPEGMRIDHTCHNRGCVNPAHLRLATVKQNAENMPDARSSTGVRGVTFYDQSWRVQVKHHGKNHYGGLFSSLAEAEAAAIAPEQTIHAQRPR